MVELYDQAHGPGDTDVSPVRRQLGTAVWVFGPMRCGADMVCPASRPCRLLSLGLCSGQMGPQDVHTLMPGSAAYATWQKGLCR